jgi:hypothetical protein
MNHQRPPQQQLEEQQQHQCHDIQQQQRQQHLKDLDQFQTILKIERELTSCIERVQPYLMSSYRTMKHTQGTASVQDTIPPNLLRYLEEQDQNQQQQHHHVRVRPIPMDIDQVHAILSVGRSYSNRTSAPSGWISTAPLIHFTTPNPLPHQLRNSLLATVQLQRTLQAQKRAQQQQDAIVAAAAALQKVQHEKEQQQQQQNENVIQNKRLKTKETSEQRIPMNTISKPTPPSSTGLSSQQQQQPQRRPTTTTLNLSDDESDDDDDDDDES